MTHIVTNAYCRNLPVCGCAQGGELCPRQWLRFWNSLTHGQHRPVGGGVQHETHLIGESRTATGAVRGKLTFVQPDQILGLTARAV